MTPARIQKSPDPELVAFIEGEIVPRYGAFAKARRLPMTLEDTRPDNAEAARKYLETFA